MTKNERIQRELIDLERSYGRRIVRYKIAPVVASVEIQASGKTFVKAWKGKAAKPAFYYSFRSAAEAQAYMDRFASNIARWIEAKNERAAKRKAVKAADHWTVGDVAHTSWGYDQTNVEFFQVVAIKPKSVVVRQILVNSSDHGQPGGGKAQPRRFEFCGPEQRCPLDGEGNFSAGPIWKGETKPAFRHACQRWDGKAVYTSSDR